MQKKILVADDSSTVQKVVNITLAKEKYVLVEARELGKTIEMLQSEEFDLVLLDFQLSGVAGVEVIRKIRKLSPSTHILLMLTAFDDLDSQVLKNLGVDDQITKPFESSKLLEKCRKILSPHSKSLAKEDDNIQSEINSDIKREKKNGEQNNILANDDEDDEILENWVESRPNIPVSSLPFEMEENNSELEGEDEGSDIKIKDVKINWTQSSSELEGLEETIPDDLEITQQENVVIVPVSEIPEEINSDVLLEEIEGWKISVPGIIGKSEEKLIVDLPPVLVDDVEEYLSTEKTFQDKNIVYEEFIESESSFSPVDSDNTENLDISDELDSIRSKQSNIQHDEIDFNSYSPKSKLVSLEELKNVDHDDKVDNDMIVTASSININMGTNPNFEFVKHDKEREQNENNFWSVDATAVDGDASNNISNENQESFPDENEEHLTNHNYEMRDVGYHLDVTGVRDVAPEALKSEGIKESTNGGIQVDDSLIRAAVEETLKTTLNQFNRQDFLAEVKKDILDQLLNSPNFINELKNDLVKSLSAKKDFVQELHDEIANKMVEEVSTIHHETSEKVAWEVIPDLAENLIRKEIKQISDSIQ